MDEVPHSIYIEMKTGSCALLKGISRHAVIHYENSLQKILELPPSYHIAKTDIAVLRYAYGIALVEVGLHKELRSALTVFADIINNDSEFSFPAAYYGIGKAYYKLNRFKDALIALNTGLSIIEPSIIQSSAPWEMHNWPGTDQVISETCPDTLLSNIKDLIEICKCPPPPDAVCVYVECRLMKEIRYSDPDFKGFTEVQCFNKCSMFYHPICWANIIIELDLFDENSIVNVPCFTPDCSSTIMCIRVTNLNGLLEREWSCRFPKDETKRMSQKIRKKKKRTDKTTFEKNPHFVEQLNKKEQCSEFANHISNEEAKICTDESDISCFGLSFIFTSDDEINEIDLNGASSDAGSIKHAGLEADETNCNLQIVEMDEEMQNLDRANKCEMLSKDTRNNESVKFKVKIKSEFQDDKPKSILQDIDMVIRSSGLNPETPVFIPKEYKDVKLPAIVQTGACMEDEEDSGALKVPEVRERGFINTDCLQDPNPNKPESCLVQSFTEVLDSFSKCEHQSLQSKYKCFIKPLIGDKTVTSDLNPNAVDFNPTLPVLCKNDVHPSATSLDYQASIISVNNIDKAESQVQSSTINYCRSNELNKCLQSSGYIGKTMVQEKNAHKIELPKIASPSSSSNILPNTPHNNAVISTMEKDVKKVLFSESSDQPAFNSWAFSLSKSAPNDVLQKEFHEQMNENDQENIICSKTAVEPPIKQHAKHVDDSPKASLTASYSFDSRTAPSISTKSTKPILNPNADNFYPQFTPLESQNCINTTESNSEKGEVVLFAASKIGNSECKPTLVMAVNNLNNLNPNASDFIPPNFVHNVPVLEECEQGIIERKEDPLMENNHSGSEIVQMPSNVLSSEMEPLAAGVQSLSVHGQNKPVLVNKNVQLFDNTTISSLTPSDPARMHVQEASYVGNAMNPDNLLTNMNKNSPQDDNDAERKTEETPLMRNTTEGKDDATAKDCIAGDSYPAVAAKPMEEKNNQAQVGKRNNETQVSHGNPSCNIPQHTHLNNVIQHLLDTQGNMRSLVLQLNERVSQLVKENDMYKAKIRYDQLQWNSERQTLESAKMMLTNKNESKLAELNKANESNSKLQSVVRALAQELREKEMAESENVTIINSLSKSMENMTDRARDAELQLLHFKQMEVANRVDFLVKFVEKINDELSVCATKWEKLPLIYSKFLLGQNKCYQYVNHLKKMKEEFLDAVEVQIEQVKKGRPLSTLKSIAMPIFSDVPVELFSLINMNISAQVPNGIHSMPSTTCTSFVHEKCSANSVNDCSFTPHNTAVFKLVSDSASTNKHKSMQLDEIKTGVPPGYEAELFSKTPENAICSNLPNFQEFAKSLASLNGSAFSECFANGGAAQQIGTAYDSMPFLSSSSTCSSKDYEDEDIYKESDVLPDCKDVVLNNPKNMEKLKKKFQKLRKVMCHYFPDLDEDILQQYIVILYAKNNSLTGQTYYNIAKQIEEIRIKS